MTRSRICPKCGKPYPIGGRCPRCAAPKATHGARSREQERLRFAENPWRRRYDTAAYRKARQLVIERQGGRCAACGRQVAARSGGRWAVTYGGVHHIRPLSQGGSDGAGNLVLLCAACHNRVEAERRGK